MYSGSSMHNESGGSSRASISTLYRVGVMPTQSACCRSMSHVNQPISSILSRPCKLLNVGRATFGWQDDIIGDAGNYITINCVHRYFNYYYRSGK